MSEGNLSANDAWKKILEKYEIVDEIQSKGIFHIKASQIKEFKEPRLMAKWDSSDSLPVVLKKNNLNILPNSRSSYVLGDFLLYEPLPELLEPVNKMDYVELPEYESIDINNISSESNAINVLILSGILDDFLGSNNTVETFNGRMGTGEFDFVVNTSRDIKQEIHVKNAQCEIDGGFENEDYIIIMEAKNVVHDDFHIRQLYYPYRLWRSKVKKPIRLVFSLYYNMIYRLFEYEFTDINDYSSIRLVRTKNYSLQDTTITFEDLSEVRRNTEISIDDDQEKYNVPFVQANSFERVISLMENMLDNPMTPMQISELMDFELRQADYYFNAGKYLGLFEKSNEDKQVHVYLTDLGKQIVKHNYKKRQLKLVEQIFKHKIFADCFDYVVQNGNIPDKIFIECEMRELNVCNEGQIARRASSVQSWMKWIVNLTRL